MDSAVTLFLFCGPWNKLWKQLFVDVTQIIIRFGFQRVPLKTTWKYSKVGTTISLPSVCGWYSNTHTLRYAWRDFNPIFLRMADNGCYKLIWMRKTWVRRITTTHHHFTLWVWVSKVFLVHVIVPWHNTPKPHTAQGWCYAPFTGCMFHSLWSHKVLTHCNLHRF